MLWTDNECYGQVNSAMIMSAMDRMIPMDR